MVRARGRSPRRSLQEIRKENIRRAEAEPLPFDPAVTRMHIHEACGGLGCEACDHKGFWLVAIGKDAWFPRSVNGGKEPAFVSEHLQQERHLERLALRRVV
jgi:hypothetical protein